MYRWQIPEDALSGVYLGKMTEQSEGVDSYIIFIVRDNRKVDLVFQCSDHTWQAYNRWPNNYSVYTHPDGGQGPWADVSFDRPYGREAQHDAIVNDPLTVGSGEFLPFEFPLAYWLEEQGYDVAYCSNSDMLSPDRGLKCNAFISVVLPAPLRPRSSTASPSRRSIFTPSNNNLSPYPSAKSRALTSTCLLRESSFFRPIRTFFALNLSY